MRARAAFIGLVVAMLASIMAVPARAADPPAVARIGILSPLSPSAVSAPSFEALRTALREQGYIEGKNITFVYRIARRGSSAACSGRGARSGRRRG
jgi:hypothetical protein